MKNLYVSFLVSVFAFTLIANIAFAACPAPPVGAPADTVIQMRANGGFAGTGPTSALDATGEGAVVYDAANKTLVFCDGTNWQTLAVSSSSVSNGIFAAAYVHSDSLYDPRFVTKYNAASVSWDSATNSTLITLSTPNPLGTYFPVVVSPVHLNRPELRVIYVNNQSFRVEAKDSNGNIVPAKAFTFIIYG